MLVCSGVLLWLYYRDSLYHFTRHKGLNFLPSRPGDKPVPEKDRMMLPPQFLTA